MKLTVRDNERTMTLELDDKEVEELCVTLSLEPEEEQDEEERRKAIQKEFDEQFNKSDYNSWHKFWRHTGNSAARPAEGEPDDTDTSEPLLSEVADPRPYYKDENERQENYEMEDVCQWVREILSNKPKWADAFIAIELKRTPVNDYAKENGIKTPSSVSHWLERARKKLAKHYHERLN